MDPHSIEPAAAWSHAAVTALASFTAAEPNERTDVLAELATGLGLNPQTLRRAITGWRFVLSLSREHPDLARELASHPIAAVEHLVRWHRRDPSGALAAARALTAGQYTVRSLAAAERKDRLARADSLATERGRARESVFRTRLADAIRPHLADRGLGTLVAPQWRPFAPPLDLIIEREWGVIIVGPYRNAESYSARAMDWCLRALGCARISGLRLLLVVPSPTSAGVYEAFLRHHGVHDSEISVVRCEEGANAEELWTMISSRIDRRRRASTPSPI
jgi:hypothetical protein